MIKKNNVCIIPARGGSKRLRKKNIIDFNGKPIISYTINAALQTKIFDKIVVSTEDNEIANISKKIGAEVYYRSEELASDKAKVVDVCIDFLKSEIIKRKKYKILCCLYPTAPLRNSIDIIKTVKLVNEQKCNYAMAVTKFHYPVHQALRIDKNSKMQPMWPSLILKRENELPELCVDNGSTYAVNIGKFLNSCSFYAEPLKGYFMPQERSVDIDTKDDLDLAKYYINHL